MNAIDGDAFHHRRLVRVGSRNKDRLFLSPAGFERHRQHAFHRANTAIERELTDETIFFERRAIEVLGDRDQPERDRQVEAWAFFLNVGRCEIDRRSAARPMVAAVNDRCRDAILAFLHCSIGQADNNDLRISMRAVDFDLYLVGVDAKNGSGVNLGEHGRNSPRLSKTPARGKVNREARLLRENSG